MVIRYRNGETLGFLRAPPSSRVNDEGRRQPALRIGGLCRPSNGGGMHQAEPGENGSEQAPERSATEAAVDGFRDGRGDYQDEKQKAVTQALQRGPIDRPVERVLDSGVRGRKLKRRESRVHRGRNHRAGWEYEAQ